ncbi:MAG: sugar ABC transporter permease [Clostridia bacterium]|nr:sugar ABC transporter permease [Clostridia bacterium]
MKTKKQLGLTTRLSWTGFLFTLPFVIGFVLFFLRPLWQSLTFVFSKVDITLDGYITTFNGLQNINYIFREDATYTTNLIESLTNLIWQVPLIVVFALFFAIIMNQKFRGRVFARAVFFLPVIIASGIILNIIQSDAAASSMLSGEVVSGGTSSQSDALKDLLANSGMDSKVISAITMITDNLFDLTWKTGIQMILFLGGLQGISPSLYEAAEVEGATGWESFWKITLPMLMPITSLNVVYTIIDSFTDANNKVMLQVMNNAQLVRYGWSSAMSWCYFLLIAVVLSLVFIVFAKIQRSGDRIKY